MSTTISFAKINDKKIFNILTEPDKSDKKIVIMSHGFRGTSIGPARKFVDFERLLLGEGFSVLRFDQPCSGNSEGDYLDSSFNEWIYTLSHFTEEYLNKGYKVSLLGQSMGATTTMAVAAQQRFKGKIPCIILWVPDAKTKVNVQNDEVYEEGGQQYRGSFWIEARDSDFFKSLESYSGGIHLVYGEEDKYVSQELRDQTIDAVARKNQPYMILPGQDHSPWNYDEAQKVYKQEIEFLKKYL